jgi:hypothetical protein
MNAKVMARAGEEATGLELAKTLVRHDEQKKIKEKTQWAHKNKRLANKGDCTCADDYHVRAGENTREDEPR